MRPARGAAAVAGPGGGRRASLGRAVWWVLQHWPVRTELGLLLIAYGLVFLTAFVVPGLLGTLLPVLVAVAAVSIAADIARGTARRRARRASLGGEEVRRWP